MKSPHFSARRSDPSTSIRNAFPVLLPPTKLSRRFPPGGIMVGTRKGITANLATVMGLVCLGILAVETEAAITFSNPIRRVSVSNSRGGSQTIERFDNGLFNETAQTTWTEPWGGNLTAQATQDSMADLTTISAKGMAISYPSFFYYLGDANFSQRTSSYFAVDFTIENPTTLYLKGILSISYDTGGMNVDEAFVVVSITGASGSVYQRTVGYTRYLSMPIDEIFTNIQSGDYKFTISATTNGHYRGYGPQPPDGTPPEIWASMGGGGRATYDLTLVPEPTTVALFAVFGSGLLIRRKR